MSTLTSEQLESIRHRVRNNGADAIVITCDEATAMILEIVALRAVIVGARDAFVSMLKIDPEARLERLRAILGEFSIIDSASDPDFDKELADLISNELRSIKEAVRTKPAVDGGADGK